MLHHSLILTRKFLITIKLKFRCSITLWHSCFDLIWWWNSILCKEDVNTTKSILHHYISWLQLLRTNVSDESLHYKSSFSIYLYSIFNTWCYLLMFLGVLFPFSSFRFYFIVLVLCCVMSKLNFIWKHNSFSFFLFNALLNSF